MHLCEGPNRDQWKHNNLNSLIADAFRMDPSTCFPAICVIWGENEVFVGLFSHILYSFRLHNNENNTVPWQTFCDDQNQVQHPLPDQNLVQHPPLAKRQSI